MAKSVKSSQTLIGKTITMLDGSQREITTCRGSYGYAFADKATLPAKLVRMFQRQLFEVAEEDFETVKDVEDNGKGYATYPRGFKFTEKKGKKVAPKAEPKPQPKAEPKPQPKDNKPAPKAEPKAQPKAPVAHATPDYEAKIEISGFDKKVGEMLRNEVKAFLNRILPTNTELRAVQVQIADSQRRLVISADISMNTYDEAQAVQDLLDSGAVTKFSLKRMSPAEIREMWEDPEVQAMIKGTAEEETSFTDDDDLAPAPEGDGDDFDFGLDDDEQQPADDDIDTDFEQPEDLSGDDLEPEEEPEDLSGDDDDATDGGDVDSEYLHIAVSNADLAHSDNKLVAKHSEAFAGALGIDPDEFYQGLVVEDGEGTHYVYIGMKLNDKQQVTMLLKNLDTDSRKRVSLNGATNYLPVLEGEDQPADVEEEDDNEGFED
jgi:hypothetical protein